LLCYSVEYLLWEVVTIIVGTIGPEDLAIHTVNASISFLTFHLGVGFMVAICTRIGNVLPVSVPRAQSICLWGSLLSYAVFIAVNVFVYLLETPIIKTFTNDPKVIAGCQKTWFDLFLFQLFINLFYVNSGIAVALGMQWTLGILSIVLMFGFGLPLIYYFAIVEDGGVEAVWRWMWPPYLLLSTILMIRFFRSDWEQIAAFVRVREGII
jgi:Na+-driven multidrug efflux pump